MERNRFIEIFLEVLGDDEHNREWTQITWDRVPLTERSTLTEERVRDAAVDWKAYGDEGGF